MSVFSKRSTVKQFLPSILLAALTVLAFFVYVRFVPLSSDVASRAISGETQKLRTLTEFELFIEKRGGRVSYPYEALVNSLKQNATPEEFGPSGFSSHTLIPTGRSLQKSKTDFSDPRIVSIFASFSSQEGIDLRKIDRLHDASEPHGPPPLYVGYAPKAEQLEVISWEPIRRRYEFIVISDFAQNKVPKVKRADRALCMSCHQHGGPIFTPAPWGEVFNASQEFQRRLNESIAGKQVVVALPAHSILDGASIDPFVREGSRRLQQVKVCQEACGSNLDCRKWTALAAITKTRLKAVDPAALLEIEKKLQGFIQATWPTDGFSYPSSVLPDRNPLEKAESGGIVRQLHVKDRTKFFQYFSRTLDSKEEIEQAEQELHLGISPLYSEKFTIFPPEDEHGVEHVMVPFDHPNSMGDPSFPRPKVATIAPQYAGKHLLNSSTDCLQIRTADEAYFSKYSVSEIASALNFKEVEPLLAKWPPRREPLVEVLTAALERKPIPFIGEPELIDPPEEQPEDGSAVNSAPAEQAFRYFQEYCGRCHIGSNSVLELSVKTDRDLSSYINSLGESLLEKIEDRSMPKGTRSWSVERKAQWEKDRPLFIEAIKSAR
jgi:hypothetical protein